MADGQICSSQDVCKYRNTKSLDVMVLMHAGRTAIFEWYKDIGLMLFSNIVMLTIMTCDGI